MGTFEILSVQIDVSGEMGRVEIQEDEAWMMIRHWPRILKLPLLITY